MSVADVALVAPDFAGVDRNAKSFLNGLLSADWKQAMIACGLGYHVDVGAFSTPIVGGGNGTAFDQDQPEFGVSVASGYCVVPLRVHVCCEMGLQTTDSHVSEILLAVDRVAAWPGDGTVTTETAINMRSNVAANPSGVSCFSAATGNITNPTLGLELAHVSKVTDVQGTAATVNTYDLSLVYEPNCPPFLIGPCCLYGYWGGDIAVSGFAQIEFLSFPASYVTGLSWA